MYADCVQRLLRCRAAGGRVAALGFAQDEIPDLVVQCEEMMALVPEVRGRCVVVLLDRVVA